MKPSLKDAENKLLKRRNCSFWSGKSGCQLKKANQEINRSFEEMENEISKSEIKRS